MSVSVTMPRLGESVSEGTVTRWLKKEGEHVEPGEPWLEVSTDKVDTEIPAPASGVLQSIKVAEDETVEVGVELAVIGDADDTASSDSGGDEQASSEPEAEPEEAAQQEEPEPEPQQAEAEPEAEADAEPEPEPEPEPAAEPEPARAQQAAPQQRQPAPSSPEQSQSQSSHQEADGEAPYVTPLVRRLSAEHGVDLASISGTGVGGRVRKQGGRDGA